LIFLTSYSIQEGKCAMNVSLHIVLMILLNLAIKLFFFFSVLVG